MTRTQGTAALALDTRNEGAAANVATHGRESRPVAWPMKRAVAYVRVSTDDQRLGPMAQRAAIEAYAAREGYEVTSWHVDTGVGGATPIADRPGLTAALLASKGCTALLVAKRDRLARDVMIAALVSRALPRGCSVVSADGTGNGDTPADALMRTILDGMSEYERALIRSRTKAALAAKRAKGERAGCVPFGYVADPSGRLTPAPAEQAAIAFIREAAARGMGQRAIVRAAAASGIASRKGTPLGLVQVQRILAAPT